MPPEPPLEPPLEPREPPEPEAWSARAAARWLLDAQLVLDPRLPPRPAMRRRGWCGFRLIYFACFFFLRKTSERFRFHQQHKLKRVVASEVARRIVVRDSVEDNPPRVDGAHWKRFVRDFSRNVAVTVVEIVLCTDTSMSEIITYIRGLANILYSVMFSAMYQIF